MISRGKISLSTLKLAWPKPSWKFGAATQELRDRERGESEIFIYLFN